MDNLKSQRIAAALGLIALSFSSAAAFAADAEDCRQGTQVFRVRLEPLSPLASVHTACRLVYTDLSDPHARPQVAWSSEREVGDCDEAFDRYVADLQHRGYDCQAYRGPGLPIGAGTPPPPPSVGASPPSTMSMGPVVTVSPINSASTPAAFTSPPPPPALNASAYVVAAPGSAIFVGPLPPAAVPPPPPVAATPSPVMTPAPEPVIVYEEAQRREAPAYPRLTVSLAPELDFARVDATDPNQNQSTLGSGALPGIGGAIGLRIDREWEAGFSADVAFGSFNSFSTTDALINSGPALWEAHVAATYHFNEWAALSFRPGLSSGLFVDRRSFSQIGLETMTVPDLTAILHLAVYRQREWEVGPELGLGLLLPASASDGLAANAGVLYRAAISIVKDRPRLPIGASLFFEERNQGTQYTSGSEAEIGLSLSLGFSFVPN